MFLPLLHCQLDEMPKIYSQNLFLEVICQIKVSVMWKELGRFPNILSRFEAYV